MNRLPTELQRLFELPEGGLGPYLGRVRCLWIEISGPADWTPLRAVWAALQTELELPAPAIAVSGRGGLQLWLSLQQPVTVAEAAAFLDALCRTHLPGHTGLRARRLRCWPDAAGTAAPPDAVPAQVQSGADPRWSAFVTPDLPAVFGEDAWLDLPPGDDAQAELLSRIEPISPTAWNRALGRLLPSPAAPMPAAAGPDTPIAFLRSVMNDPQAPLALRVKAARALLAAGLGDTA